MKCMCPKCGKKHDSQDLVFDFCDMIKERMLELINMREDDPSIKGQWRNGCETFFSGNLFVPEREGVLWELPAAPGYHPGTKERFVEYAFHVDQLLKLRGAEPIGDLEKESKENLERFISWMNAGRAQIEAQKCILWLQKTGEGDIHFDRIFQADRKNKPLGKVRCCPNCHQEMSYFAGRYLEWTLTVLGGPRVSKSTTLTACADSFIRSTGDIRWRGAIEDAGYQLFEKEYLRTYRDGIRIEPTSDVEKIPRVSFEVSFRNAKKKICLTFVDLPGEFNNNDRIDDRIYEMYREFYENVDFVWYCTDPGEVKQIGEEEELTELGYGKGKSVVNVERLVDNMRKLSSFFQRARKRIPVMYIFGKSDNRLVTEEEKRRYGLFEEGQETEDWECLDVHPFFDQAMNVRTYMKMYNPDMVTAFEECFPDRSYAAISAYGCTPRKTAADPAVSTSPFNCRVPFYWMLALRNCLPVRTVVSERRFLHIVHREETGMLSEFTAEQQETIQDNLLMHHDIYTY